MPDNTLHTEPSKHLPAQQALVRRLRGSEVAAFTEIYQAYTEKMITWAFNVLEDRDQSMDIAQDVLLWIWVNREMLDPALALEAYLYTAVRNAVLKVIRSGKVRERVFDQIEKRIWSEPTTENMVYQRELQGKLKEAISQLPERVRQVYRLSREENLSYHEIADKLSISSKTVENHLSKAMKQLRASLGDFLPLVLLFLGGK